MSANRTLGIGLHLAGTGSILALCFVWRNELGRDPVLHVLIQLPALALAGWLVGAVLRERTRLLDRIDERGVASLFVVLFTGVFWMLPRSLDAALDDPAMESLKFISLPLLIGVPLALSWPKLHPLVRAFLKANTVSMLGVLAFLYTHAAVRICNNYLVSDQERLGLGFLFVAVALSVIWSLPLFFAPPDAEADEASWAATKT